MCGIAGKIVFDNSGDAKQVVEAICNKMIHRGPDNMGIAELPHIVLGHRRLSIIDLSDNAKQPMSSFDGRYHITFNGEIYNFQNIQTRLKSAGYKFKSNSDTEVVINAFAEYGEKCVNEFNGMFAFAIWDTKEQTLFLARDRFGKKPLFYYQNPSGGFSFASEISALKEDKSIPLKYSISSLNCYLALGYILNPDTMYEDIYLLEPASTMLVKDYGKKLIKKTYWDYSNSFRNKITNNDKNISSNILDLLKASISRRMISDVPVGAFLSGGLDSSSVVALMKEFHKDELHTFSVGFDQKSSNELPDADKAAHWIGTKHHGFICKPENNIELLNEAVGAFDQLFADTSLIPMIEVSKLASKYITVVLSGDGADEIFAGYITYKADGYYNYAKHFPNLIKKYLSELSINDEKKLGWKYKAKQFFYGTQYDYKQAHYLWRIMFHPEERVKILGEENREVIMDTDPFKIFKKNYDKVDGMDKLDQHLYVDAMTWLTDDILVKLDRSSMHSSIEARTPYLDIDLVNYVASIPSSLKLKGNSGKFILKKALKETLPEFVINKKKSGFNAPVGSWIGINEKDEFRSFNKFIFNNKINYVAK